jgi:hypothetical protein
MQPRITVGSQAGVGVQSVSPGGQARDAHALPPTTSQLKPFEQSLVCSQVLCAPTPEGAAQLHSSVPNTVNPKRASKLLASPIGLTSALMLQCFSTARASPAPVLVAPAARACVNLCRGAVEDARRCS